MNHLSYSIVRVVIALFFVFFGIVGLIIPWSADIRYRLIRFILEDALAISLFGVAFIVVGAALIANIFMRSKRNYYYLKSNEGSLAIEDGVLYDYLAVYWKQLFPDQDISYRASVVDNQIIIDIELPYLPEVGQRDLLERIKSDLKQLFIQKLGYQQEFLLTASFEADPPVVKSSST